MIWDVAICGGGPAGLAAALHAVRAGFSAIVLERSAAPDKACGEGLMPRGLRALESLGVLAGIPEARPFRGIRPARNGPARERGVIELLLVERGAREAPRNRQRLE